jgi:hypothetical protein
MFISADDSTMDTLVNKTIRLSEGETEMLMRALVEATEASPASRPGETQILLRETKSAQPTGNSDGIEQTNFIL